MVHKGPLLVLLKLCLGWCYCQVLGVILSGTSWQMYCFAICPHYEMTVAIQSD